MRGLRQITLHRLRAAYWTIRPRLIRSLPFRPTPARAFARLPWTTLGECLADGPLLVLAPHPDDESLGCGGVIAACCAAGRAVHVVVLTDGAASHGATQAWSRPRLAALRAQELRKASAVLGVAAEHVHFLAAPDGAAPQDGPEFARLTERLTALVTAAGARNLLTSWRHDPHPDHVAAALLADAVAQRVAVRRWAFPVWGWLRDDVPHTLQGWRIDIRHHRPAKRRAIAAHVSQTTDLVGHGLSRAFLRQFDRDYEVILTV